MTLSGIPKMAYNAAFTPMGRRHFRYFVRKFRARLSAKYRRTGIWIYRLKHGGKFVLHRGNHLSELIYLEGDYEPLETLIVRQVVRSGDVALDLGANVGYFTSVMDGLVKPGGEVHAFEPGKGTFARLEETKQVLKLHSAILHKKAVNNSMGYIEFWTSNSGFDAQQGMLKNAGLTEDATCDRVECLTLDAFVQELNGRGRPDIAFIKCDIEGAELIMLKGAGRVLNLPNPPNWLLEHNRSVLRGYGASTMDLLNFFKDCDVYYIRTCWPPTVMLHRQAEKWNGDPDQLPDECNLVIFPRKGIYAERAAKVRQAGLIP